MDGERQKELDVQVSRLLSSMHGAVVLQSAKKVDLAYMLAGKVPPIVVFDLSRTTEPVESPDFDLQPSAGLEEWVFDGPCRKDGEAPPWCWEYNVLTRVRRWGGYAASVPGSPALPPLPGRP